jgi:hypothetical protein
LTDIENISAIGANYSLHFRSLFPSAKRRQSRLSIAEWASVISRYSAITGITGPEKFAVLEEALRAHHGNDTATLSLLWLCVTGRVLHPNQEGSGLWVWKCFNDLTGRASYLVCAANPDRSDEIMIFGSLSTIKMTAAFVQHLPEPAAGYSIVRVPQFGHDRLDVVKWKDLLNDFGISARVVVSHKTTKAQFGVERDLDYGYGPLVVPVSAMVGKVVQDGCEERIYLEKDVIRNSSNGLDGDTSRRSGKYFRKDVYALERDINYAHGKVTVEKCEFENEGQLNDLRTIVGEWGNRLGHLKSKAFHTTATKLQLEVSQELSVLLPEKLEAFTLLIDSFCQCSSEMARQLSESVRTDPSVAHSYDAFYETAFLSAQACQRYAPGPRFQGLLFRRLDRKPVGFCIDEYVTKPGFSGVTQTIASLAITDQDSGQPGLPAYMTWVMANRSREQGIDAFCQGGVEWNNPSLWTHRKKVAAFAGTRQILLATLYARPRYG